MMSRKANGHMSAFAPCANAAFSCAQSDSANAIVMILDAVLASIFVALISILSLISILGLISLILLAVLVLAVLLIFTCYTPWRSEPTALPV